MSVALGTQYSWLDACLKSCQWFTKFYPHRFGPEHPEAVGDCMDSLDCGGPQLERPTASSRSRMPEISQSRCRTPHGKNGLTGTLPMAEGSCLSSSPHPRKHGHVTCVASPLPVRKLWVKYYAIGDTCHACCKWYHSRQRSIEHLKFVPSCLDVLQAFFPALDDASVQTMDQADHAHTLSMRQQAWWATKALLPVRRVQGPMLPPAGSQDASVLEQKWEQRLEPSGTAFMNLQGRRTDGSADDPQVLLFEDDIHPFVFQSVAGPNPGDGRFAASNLAREHARLHIKTLVFVHVFSGFRRENDLHQLLEHQIWGAIHFFVISIDMCMQKIEGNLASSKAFQFWMHQIATGQVCGMGGGPPCETFTAARLMEGGSPAAIRRFALIGYPNLRQRQWQQCLIGSRLIRFLVEALLCLAHTGGTGFLEHPQFPLWATHKNPASVWRSREIRLLHTLACVGITSFDQCTLGCDAIKPTTILHVRLPELRRLLLAGGHGGRCNHGAKAHERMQAAMKTGSSAQHVQRSTQPASMTSLLVQSRAIRTFACGTFAGCDTSRNLPAEFSQFVVTNFVPMEVVQPDYHG